MCRAPWGDPCPFRQESRSTTTSSAGREHGRVARVQTDCVALTRAGARVAGVPRGAGVGCRLRVDCALGSSAADCLDR